jgi:hypothetical protein
MPAANLITTQQFSRLPGLPGTPAVINVRMDVLSIADTIAIFHLKIGTIQTLAVRCAAGVVLYLAGALT